MAEVYLSFDDWVGLSDLEKTNLILQIDDLPFQILVLASQDSSFEVRSFLLAHFEGLINQDMTWLSLLRKIASNDPDQRLRDYATQLLSPFSGAS